jgi:transcriptional regulator
MGQAAGIAELDRKGLRGLMGEGPRFMRNPPEGGKGKATMYTPNDFRVTDQEQISAFMQTNNFATLVSWDGERLAASHLLFEVVTGDPTVLTLNCHLARANNQWRTFHSANEVLVIFGGPHTYISPRWYTSINNVPTWNYQAVHAYGTPDIITDQDELYGLLARLVDRYESTSEAIPEYHLDALPKAYVLEQMKGIIGLRIHVTRLEAKFKLSQNRSQPDRDNIVVELRRRGDENSSQIATAMHNMVHRSVKN